MPDYYHFTPNYGTNFCIKYVIEYGVINTYQRGVLLRFIRSWELTGTFYIDQKTTVKIDPYIDEYGSGSVTVKNSTSEYIYWVFQHAREFSRELSSLLDRKP